MLTPLNNREDNGPEDTGQTGNADYEEDSKPKAKDPPPSQPAPAPARGQQAGSVPPPGPSTNNQTSGISGFSTGGAPAVTTAETPLGRSHVQAGGTFTFSTSTNNQAGGSNPMVFGSPTAAAAPSANNQAGGGFTAPNGVGTRLQAAAPSTHNQAGGGFTAPNLFGSPTAAPAPSTHNQAGGISYPNQFGSPTAAAAPSVYGSSASTDGDLIATYAPSPAGSNFFRRPGDPSEVIAFRFAGGLIEHSPNRIPIATHGPRVEYPRNMEDAMQTLIQQQEARASLSGTPALNTSTPTSGNATAPMLGAQPEQAIPLPSGKRRKRGPK